MKIVKQKLDSDLYNICALETKIIFPKAKVKLPHLGFICLSVLRTPLASHSSESATELPTYGFGIHLPRHDLTFSPRNMLSGLSIFRYVSWETICIVKSVWLQRKCGEFLEIGVLGLGFCFASFLFLIPPGKWFVGSTS